jgi:hypothetical protein
LNAAGVTVELIIRKGVGHSVYERGDAKVIANWLDKLIGKEKPGAK